MQSLPLHVRSYFRTRFRSTDYAFCRRNGHGLHGLPLSLHQQILRSLKALQMHTQSLSYTHRCMGWGLQVFQRGRGSSS